MSTFDRAEWKLQFGVPLLILLIPILASLVTRGVLMLLLFPASLVLGLMLHSVRLWPIWFGATPAAARASRMPPTIASSGARGVVKTLLVTRRPGSSSAMSVKVPPTSTPITPSGRGGRVVGLAERSGCASSMACGAQL